MGSILGGGGGGGGGSGGDEANTTEKALPSPAQVAATREAFNTASGMAGVAKNMPYYAQIASSPSYRKALQNTANTWSDWMGTAPLDLSEGMAPITQGQFGSVIDAGQIMNDKIATLPPDVQKLLAQWTGPGAIQQGGAYSPAVYDPYVQQKPLLHQGSLADGGVGTIGAGGIPVGGGTGGGPAEEALAQARRALGLAAAALVVAAAAVETIHMGGKTYRKNANGSYTLVRTYGGGQGGAGQGGLAARGGMGQRAPTNINPGGGGLLGAFSGGGGGGFNHGFAS